MSVWAGLIERLERATDFDRLLDRDIGIAAFGWTLRGGMIHCPDGSVYADHPGGMCPAFTESLDAALTLVPEGVGSSLVMSGSAKPYASLYSQGRGHIARASAVTLPIALCIASIKARVSHGVDEPG